MAPFFKSTKIFLEFTKIVAVFDDLFIIYGLFIDCYLFSVHSVKVLPKITLVHVLAHCQYRTTVVLSWVFRSFGGFKVDK